MASEDAPPRRGLLVDFGGVLTTNVFGSFEAFCRAEGLEPDAVAQRFRGDPDARQSTAWISTRASISSAAMRARSAGVSSGSGIALVMTSPSIFSIT